MIKSASMRAPLLIGAVIVANACASILDFPNRVADTADATSSGGISGSGGSGGFESGVGGTSASGGYGAGSGGSKSDASLDAVADVAKEASSDADADSGVVSNPGAVSCGNQSCAVVSGDVCCVDAATGSRSCTVANQCPASKVKMFCDEQADCLPGEICCAQVDTGTAQAFRTECLGSCNSAGLLQICKTSAECGAGVCKTRTCTGGAAIEACTGCP